MKSNSTVKERQNDKEAISLLKASVHCLETERWLKYIMIFLSFAVCLAAILNRYLPQMASNVPNIVAVQEKASTYLNLISGAIIIAGLPIGFYTSRMHTEGTVLRDRYDAYVFDNAPNLSILRPISQSFVSVYEKKIKKPDKEYQNYIYPKDEAVNDATAQFDYINKEVHADYNLYLSIQPFYMTIWLGFCILIIIIALSFNDAFITTLINILIPSLSAISTICNSWYSCRLQMRQLTNLINIIDQIQAMSPEKKKQYITDKENMRLLSDGLFNYRSSSFVIPVFLVKHHQKNLEKTKNSGQIGESSSLVETSKTNSEKKQNPSETVKKDVPTAKKEVAATIPANNKKESTLQNTETKKETIDVPATKKEPAVKTISVSTKTSKTVQATAQKKSESQKSSTQNKPSSDEKTAKPKNSVQNSNEEKVTKTKASPQTTSEDKATKPKTTAKK